MHIKEVLSQLPVRLFAHEPPAATGGERPAGVVALLRRLAAAGALATPRARLQRFGAGHGLRAALRVDLLAALPGPSPLGGFAVLWLAAAANGRVGFYGVAAGRPARAVGGQVIRDFPVLDPAGGWLRALAVHTTLCLVRSLRGEAPDEAGLRALFEAELALLSTAVRAFHGCLDAEVLGLLAAEGRWDPSAYNHLGAVEGPAKRNRRQAAHAFPWFQDALRDDWRLRRVVDAGQPLAPALEQRFAVSPSVLRRCRALPPAAVPQSRRSEVLRLAAEYPAEYLPSEAADWAAFLRVAPRLADLARVLRVDAPVLAASFKRGWQAGLESLREKHGAELDIDGIFDLMQAAYWYGLRPVLGALVGDDEGPAQPPAGFFPLWFARYDLARLHGMAARWRLAFGKVAAERVLGQGAAGLAELAWPVLADAPARFGPYRVVELTSLGDLITEGERLGHCAASYAVKCVLGVSSLYSVRDDAGSPLSTFEVAVAGAHPALVQHRGPCNTHPPAGERQVVQQFVAEVLARLAPERVAAIRRARCALGAPVAKRLLAPNTSVDGPGPEVVALLAEAIAFAHPAEARRDGLLDFAQRHGDHLLAGLAA
jgi:hypothetical protein